MFVVTKTSTVCGDQQNSNGKKFSCKFQKNKFCNRIKMIFKKAWNIDSLIVLSSFQSLFLKLFHNIFATYLKECLGSYFGK